MPIPDARTLAKRSALQRLPEVVNVLKFLLSSRQTQNNSMDMLLRVTPNEESPTESDRQDDLRLQQNRVSMPLASVLDKLKDSLRNPISEDEGELCLRLLSDEISPGWVELFAMGSVVGVVIRSTAMPSVSELRERVDKAIVQLSVHIDQTIS
jgi:hypothetical protein